jgi:hypothetical protein
MLCGIWSVFHFVILCVVGTSLSLRNFSKYSSLLFTHFSYRVSGINIFNHNEQNVA